MCAHCINNIWKHQSLYNISDTFYLTSHSQSLTVLTYPLRTVSTAGAGIFEPRRSASVSPDDFVVPHAKA